MLYETSENRDSLNLASPEISPDNPSIIEFTTRPQTEWLSTLAKLGINANQYVSGNAYTASMWIWTIHQLLSLRETSFIRAIIPYLPDFKLSSRLKKRKGALPYKEFMELKIDPESIPFNEDGNLTIVVHNPRDLVKAQEGIQALGGKIILNTEDSLRVALNPTIASIKKITSLPSVKWIEPYVPPGLCLDVSAGIINAPPMWNSRGLMGEDQIVAVADTGLDTGKNDNTMHLDIRGRIAGLVALGRPNDSSDAALPPGPNANEGHGTHVAGTIMGDGKASAGSFKGIANGARIFFQSVMDANGNLGGLPGNLSNLFQPAFDAGARIHSNSWGSKTNGLYDAQSRGVDTFVWNHRDMVIVIAAGNEGKDADNDGIVDLDSLDSPGTAKNCITIGASENNKPTNKITYATRIGFTAEPLKSDLFANNPEGIAAFSSRGPTDDGRIKPDVMAPGTSILATKSSLTTDGFVDGKSPNTQYMFLSGTSMATPHVAGATALVRQRLANLILDPEDETFHLRKKVKDLSPTAAFVKSVLINGADKMQGQYKTPKNDSGGETPNNHQGFGRINLEKALFPTSPTVFESFDGDRLSEDEQREYQFKIKSNSVPLKMTLAWTDFPGNQLVNDLDLVVKTPDDEEFHGNFHQPTSPDFHLDATNNVEQVLIEKPVEGVYRINVIGDTVSQDAPGGVGQDYALILSGNISTTLAAIHHKPSESFPDNPGPLPVLELCNKVAPFNPVQGENPLIHGDKRSDLVEHLQKMLRDLGFPLGDTGPDGDGVDGKLGALTVKAVENFQKEHKDCTGKNLRVDRKVGPETSDALNRAMVGIWYDENRTPTELTEDSLLITATRDKFEGGLDMDTTDLPKGVKIAVIDRATTHTITLLDPEEEKFEWDGQGEFKILDKDENEISTGNATKDDQITFEHNEEPVTVNLKVEKTFRTFYVRKPETDSKEDTDSEEETESEGNTDEEGDSSDDADTLP